MNELLEMLTYKRPNRAKSERKYINRFIAPHAKPDKYGNYIVTVGDNPSVMFSSHTDTVHRTSGRQKVFVDTIQDIAYVDADCLGADDATGNWIMLEMIREKIPGLYIFHRGEERGGLGSSYISLNTPEVLAGIQCAVAFDRAYKEDVITSQSSGKCCSTTFGLALAGELGDTWQLADGIFTDTANYNHLIPECTNISVGYMSQHTAKETQCLNFAQSLRDKVMLVKWNELPIERDVDDFDDGFGYGYGYSGAYSSAYGMSSRRSMRKPKQATGKTEISGMMPGQALWYTMRRFVTDNPDIVTDYLVDNGITAGYLRKYEWWEFDSPSSASYQGLDEDDSDELESWLRSRAPGFNSDEED